LFWICNKPNFWKFFLMRKKECERCKKSFSNLF